MAEQKQPGQNQSGQNQANQTQTGQDQMGRQPQQQGGQQGGQMGSQQRGGQPGQQQQFDSSGQSGGGQAGNLGGQGGASQLGHGQDAGMRQNQAGNDWNQGVSSGEIGSRGGSASGTGTSGGSGRPGPGQPMGTSGTEQQDAQRRQDGGAQGRAGGQASGGQASGGHQGHAHTQVREHMEVVGADGVHVGTVDHVDGERIKLTRSDTGAGAAGQQGKHHYLPAGLVAAVEGNTVRLSANADVAYGMEEGE